MSDIRPLTVRLPPRDGIDWTDDAARALVGETFTAEAYGVSLGAGMITSARAGDDGWLEAEGTIDLTELKERFNGEVTIETDRTNRDL